MQYLDNGQYFGLKNSTFAEAFRFWLMQIKRFGVAENTFNSYCIQANKHIFPYFEQKGIRLSQMTQFVLQEYYHSRLRCGLSGNTIMHHHANIRDFMQWAWKCDLIEENCADKVILPKKERYVPNFLDVDQIPKCLQLFKGDVLEPLVWLAMLLGLRRSEVLGIRWNNIDFANRTITIQQVVVQTADPHTMCRKTLVKQPKTKNSRRVLSLPKQLLAMLFLLRRMKLQNIKLYGEQYNFTYSDFVFTGKTGDLYDPDWVSKRFRKKILSSDLPYLRFHDLRHSCGSMLHYLGYDLEDIKEWLGHSSVQTTSDVYLHLGLLQKRKISDSINQLIETDY